MKRPISIAAVATVVACTSPAYGKDPAPPPGCDRAYVVSNDFSVDEQDGLERAVSRWNEVAIETFCLTPEITPGAALDASKSITKTHYKGDTWWSIYRDNGNQDWLGIYFETDHIVIVDDLDKKTFYLVALHELGHAHGLEHVSIKPAIMYPTVGSADDFTDLDMAECRRVQACAGS